MSLSPRIQGGGQACPNEQEPENVPGTDRDISVNTPLDSKLRAELKREYYHGKEEIFGVDIKDDWRMMRKVVGPMPVVHRRSLQRLCNKPTILYFESSAQSPCPSSWPAIVFACIYKRWFRCHNSNPDLNFGKFFALPLQITPTGPQTIPEILKAHAHLCDQAASDLPSLKSEYAESCPNAHSRWQHRHLLPLCRAIIVVLDEYLPPVRNVDRTISLDDEVQRRSAVLVLTGYDQGLSAAVNFDTLRSESLPLARPDVSETDSVNVIRVSLKTAVQFIVELQQREERAFSNSKRDPADTASNSKTDGCFTAVNSADEYVEDILDNPSKSDSKSKTILGALHIMQARERGEDLHETEFSQWNPN